MLIQMNTGVSKSRFIVMSTQNIVIYLYYNCKLTFANETDNKLLPSLDLWVKEL